MILCDFFQDRNIFGEALGTVGRANTCHPEEGRNRCGSAELVDE